MIKPLRNIVFIEPLREEDKTESGILLPQEGKAKSEQGKVFAIGPDVSSIKVGDTVIFKKYAPEKIKIDGNDYLVCDEDDISAVFEK